MTTPNNRPPSLLKRWWQSFGFGIESHTDYSFLHEVLRERLPFYAYDDLHRLFPSSTGSERRIAHLLFRICNYAHNMNVYTIGSFSAIEQKAIEMAHISRHRHTTRFSVNDLDADIVIVKDIASMGKVLWHNLIQSSAITYDIQSIGIAIFSPQRYPEHYHLLLKSLY